MTQLQNQRMAFQLNMEPTLKTILVHVSKILVFNTNKPMTEEQVKNGECGGKIIPSKLKTKIPEVIIFMGYRRPSAQRCRWKLFIL